MRITPRSRSIVPDLPGDGALGPALCTGRLKKEETLVAGSLVGEEILRGALGAAGSDPVSSG
ncbi:MAG TPA: hypothetical protein VLJ38_07120 [Polyangiaceae bacterium]|nr:hypothetical protein [Polyangiaceae bacterium]